MSRPTVDCSECGAGGAYNRKPSDPRALCDRCYNVERLEAWMDILWEMNYARPNPPDE